jgi:ribosomal protein S3
MKNLIFRLRLALSLFWETFASDEIDSKPFRRHISNFFYEEYYDRIITSFTEVKVFIKKDKYIVQITTHSPGILIGKGGSTIDSLKDWLNNGEFFLPVEIRLIESKMWYKLY